MTGNEREVRVEQRADRILTDDRAVAAYARFVDRQLRFRRLRNLFAGLRALARVVLAAAVAFLSAGLLASPGPALAGGAGPGSGR
jgi:hypothetical protein